MNLIGHILACQFRQRLGRGDFHRIVDGAGPNVEGAAEDVGEAEDVVDLIGVIAASGGDDGMWADRPRLFRGDLRIRIGHGEDDRLVGHAGDHVLGQRALYR